jgi:hypothetical protein
MQSHLLRFYKQRQSLSRNYLVKTRISLQNMKLNARKWHGLGIVYINNVHLNEHVR